MGLLPVHSDAFWFEECSCHLFRVVVAAFKEYIHKFLEVYFDDWTVFGMLKKHGASLRDVGYM